MKKLLASVAMVGLAATATAANAETVMLKGSNSNSAIATFLQSNGYTVVANSNDYTGVDAVILLRSSGDASLTDFVNSGGLLITEWSGADWAMSSLLGGFVSGGGFVGTGTEVSFSADGLALGLGANVGTSYTASIGSQFFRNFGGLGSGSVLATRPGDIAAIVGGSAGSGYVVANGIDWADTFGSTGAANGQVLLNSLGLRMSSAVPEPATWMMLLLGFFAIGGLLRRDKLSSHSLSVTYS